jgi:hypothetical protein
MIRGEIWWADLGPHRSQEQTGRRPVIVWQSNALNDQAAIVRRSAIDLLGHLKAHGATSKVAEHLNDQEPVEGAWFDDESTPGQAARRFLLTVDSPEAAGLLANADRL